LRLEVPFEFPYTDRMKNKKYLEVDLYTGKTSNFNLQEAMEDEGSETPEEFFQGMKKVTSKDGYTSYHAEEVLFIELPA
jgi:hypothetical protein